VDLDPSASYLIPHVQDSEKRESHLQELKRNEKTPAEILCIHHLHEMGLRFMEEDIPGDLFIL